MRKKQKNFSLLTCLLLALLILSPISNAQTQGHFKLKAYQALYGVYWQGLEVGSSLHTLKKISPKHYQATAVTKPILPILPFHSFESSQFSVAGNQIYPIRYHYQSQEKNRHKNGTLQFSWQKKQWIDEKTKGAVTYSPLPSHTQDKITLFFQLRNDLRMHKKTFHYTVVEPGKIKIYHFKMTGQETLKTPLGVLETLRLEHISDNEERLTKIWLAKNLDYLIIRLQQFKKGKLTVESRIRNLEMISKITN